MKRVLLVCLGLIMVGSYAGCLPEETTMTGTGGTNGTAGNGAAGTSQGGSGVAGTVGAGGDSSGVSGSSGGDSSGVAGSIAGNGAAGTGQGGTAGTGQGGTGQGGTAGTGQGGTAGNASGGRGGAAGTAPGGTGGTASGGRGGAAGTAPGGTGGGGLPTIGDLFPTTGTLGSFDGRLITMPCGDENTAGTDCAGGGGYLSSGGTTAMRINCSGAFTASNVYNVGGEAGKRYTVTIHVYGMAEPKQYCNNGISNCTADGVMREAGTARPAATPTGAISPMPTGWAVAKAGHGYPVSDYNTYEIRVCSNRTCADRSATDETQVYYLNSDTREGHWTYVLNYVKQIQVVGGGSIRVKNYDRNCRQIKNCGPEGVAATNCATEANRRIIDIASAMPRPPTGAPSSGGLTQPNMDPARGAGASGQWLLIDVVSVDSVQ